MLVTTPPAGQEGEAYDHVVCVGMKAALQPETWTLVQYRDCIPITKLSSSHSQS